MSEISSPTVGSSSPPVVRSAGGGTQLEGDLRVALLFMNEARYRALERLFGCPKDQANLLTLVVALALVEAMRERWQRFSRRPMVPSGGDTMLGMASVRELLVGVAGPRLRETPQLGTLLVVAFVGRTAGPTVIRLSRGMRSGLGHLNGGFRRRYGYLVDVGHRRQRRYEAATRRRAQQSAGGDPLPG